MEKNNKDSKQLLTLITFHTTSSIGNTILHKCACNTTSLATLQ